MSKNGSNFGCEHGSVCGSDKCRREVIVSSNGHVSIDNMFTCKIIKDQVIKLRNILDRKSLI